MATWFEATSEVNCTLDIVEEKTKNVATFIEKTVALMPGISSAQLLETDDASVKIKTNEGNMVRSNIVRTITPSAVVLEFDESYQAGSMMKTTSHHKNVFSLSSDGISHKLTISDVSANGFMGWLYRTFGAGNIGKAILAINKTHLES